MKKYIFIGIGGFAGAVLRYLLKSIDINSPEIALPLTTLATNIIGVFLLAFISVLSIRIWKLDSEYHLGITVGFLGSFTTFSTLCKESVDLFTSGYSLYASAYISVSLILGFFAAYFGTVLADIAVSKYNQSRKGIE